MTVREATSADLDAFVASGSALFAEDGGTRDPHMDTTWPAREGHDYYAAAIADPNVLCLVAVVDDRVVGHLLGRLKGHNPTRPSVPPAPRIAVSPVSADAIALNPQTLEPGEDRLVLDALRAVLQRVPVPTPQVATSS